MGSDKPPNMKKMSEALAYLRDVIEISGQALLPSFDDHLLQSIVDTAGQLFNAAAASIALVDAQNNCLEFKVSYGHGNEDVVGRQIPLDSGIAGYVVMTGQPIAIADVLRDPRFNQEFAESTGYVPKSILATPLEWQDRIIGVMEVLDKIEAPRFDLRDMEFLGLFAQQASIAIAQSQQYNQIASVMLATLQAWVEEKAPSDVGPILQQILQAEVRSGDMDQISQLASILHELLRTGEAERRMALAVLEAIRGYLVEHSERMRI